MAGFNKIFLTVAAISSLFIFSSCGDDPVAPPPEQEFDSARFNWRSMQLPTSSIACAWAADTHNIFIVDNFRYTFYHLKNGNITSFSLGNYAVNEIGGISPNEVYLFGTEPFPDNMLTIIKWNGSGLEYYPTGIISNSSLTIRGAVRNSSEIWIGSESGIVKYDGSAMTQFNYSQSGMLLNNLFITNENKIRYNSSRIAGNELQQELYEFSDTGFIRIFEQKVEINPTTVSLSEVGGITFGLSANSGSNMVCVNEFISNGFTQLYCFNNKISSVTYAQSDNPVGVSLNNFIIGIEVTQHNIFNPPRSSGIIHWNGIKPSIEFGFINGFGSYNELITACVNSDCYIVIEPANPTNCTLFIGTRK